MFNVFAFIFLFLFLLEPKPVCYYPSEQPILREAILKDIELRINKLSEQPLWFYHTGNSMYPTIKDGQTCLCKTQDAYKEGDIVSFYRLDEGNELTFITHRIKEITPNGFITKGDNNQKIDYTSIPKENVFCKIVESPNIINVLRKN